jgi:hypothetical protein
MSQLVQDSLIAKPRVALRAVYAAIDWSLTSPPISNESTNPILRRQDVDTHTYAMLPKIQSTHNVVHAPGKHNGQPNFGASLRDTRRFSLEVATATPSP